MSTEEEAVTEALKLLGTELVLVWRDERLNEICRSTPLVPGQTKIAIPLDAFCADLLTEGTGNAQDV